MYTLATINISPLIFSFLPRYLPMHASHKTFENRDQTTNPRGWKFYFESWNG